MEGRPDGRDIMDDEDEMVVDLLQLDEGMVALHEGQHMAELLRLEVFGAGTTGKMAHKGLVLQHHLLKMQVARKQTEWHRKHQFLGLGRHLSEDVHHLLAEVVEFVEFLKCFGIKFFKPIYSRSHCQCI